MSVEVRERAMPRAGVARPRSKRRRKSPYPYWFYLPAFVVFFVFFLLPTFSSFYYSLTRWTLFDSEFIGLENFRQFFEEPALTKGLTNTLIYAVTTSGLEGGPRDGAGRAADLERDRPGVHAVGRLLPRAGEHDRRRADVHGADGARRGADQQGARPRSGSTGPRWLVDPKWALMSVALVDVWKGVGLATVIYIAGIVSVPREYYDAARVDGATPAKLFRYITLPLAWPATVTVIILSLIGGLRSFDLIWAMTRGGPGFTTDVIASVIYKQYQAGFYGLSTAGNVVLFVLVTAIILPLYSFLRRREVQL